jgi:hypothetical protein
LWPKAKGLLKSAKLQINEARAQVPIVAVTGAAEKKKKYITPERREKGQQIPDRSDHTH